MSSEGSVTGWIAGLQRGYSQAARMLWDRYILPVLRIAHKKLHGRILHTADEQDVAASAFASFWLGVQAGRFPELHGRDNVWGVLLRITSRKAIDYVQYDLRKKRRHESGVETPD
jgi:hypothetical protein